jgi:hypothetical protein
MVVVVVAVAAVVDAAAIGVAKVAGTTAAALEDIDANPPPRPLGEAMVERLVGRGRGRWERSSFAAIK